jgi:hypothetical protein
LFQEEREGSSAAPDEAKLWAQVSAAGRLPDVLEQLASGGTDEYLPWDKVRFKTPPGDLSVEEWWLAIKLLRRAVGREIPTLRDVRGRPFSFTLPDVVLRPSM